MAVSKYFDQFLSTKPSLHELTEHIRVSSKWYSLGVLLKLDAKKLEGIRAKNEDSTFKLIKMFQLWLMTNPNATRREIIEALQNDAISEHAIAEKYEKSFKKGEYTQKYTQYNSTCNQTITKYCSMYSMLLYFWWLRRSKV